MKRVRSYLSILKAEEIVRRYLVINSFDGALVALGIVLGFFAAGNLDASLVIRVVLASGFAMFLSGFFGCYFAEKAERSREIKEMEGAMLRRLDKSVIHEASRRIPLLAAAVDGLSPLAFAVAIVSPFFFAPFIGVTCALYASIALGVGLLFSLGCFLGKVSKTSVLLNGLRMVSVAIFVIAVMLLLRLV